jgi:N-acetylglucosamine kinase-like BadF-type ATPase
MKYFIGVDGGGSGTRAVVVNDMFQVIGQGEAGASNHYAVGLKTAAQNCLEAAEAAIDNAVRIEHGLRRTDIAAWGLGLAGVRREGDAALMRAQLAPLIGSGFILDHDAAAAQCGAFLSGPGIVLSAGTGAICFGVDEYEERFFADGWGAVLGDEGSAYWIGQQALKAVCRAADGRGPHTRLTAPILHHLHVRDCDELVQLVYAPHFTRDRMARLAQVVFNNAEAGGQVAAGIRDTAATHLGNSIMAVTRAMLARARDRSEPNQPPPMEIAIALRGGLFDDDYFRAAVGYVTGEKMVELKRDYWPIASWRIVKPQSEAAVGAALLAQKHFGPLATL